MKDNSEIGQNLDRLRIFQDRRCACENSYSIKLGSVKKSRYYCAQNWKGCSSKFGLPWIQRTGELTLLRGLDVNYNAPVNYFTER